MLTIFFACLYTYIYVIIYLKSKFKNTIRKYGKHKGNYTNNMEKNRCKNDYREHVRCGMQRRVNILMTDVPKKGNISSETEKKFKDSRDKIFLKQSLNLYLIGHILS